ncbi:NAD-dependent epimerase/dehydratase family protein [Nocardioides sp.]|uniref:NAD-dependent epimerase/dehydratase family protein n=1 Tax=Nocardioides sp. TaxID=35761 RepID=UPI0035132D4E
MRVLLTGAAGFIGAEIHRQLLGAGHEVVAVDLMLPHAHRDATPPEGVLALDVRDADRWQHHLDGVDVVCHQAAVVGAGVTVADLPLYAAHNDLGTAALMAAMAARGVTRLVQASSMVVYGEGRYRCAEHGERPAPPRPREALQTGAFDVACDRCGAPLTWDTVPEDAPLDPRSSYAVSKLAQELYATVWARQAGAAAISLRYHNVYGPGMPRDTPYSGVAAMFRSALAAGQPPRVFEDGAQMRDFVHVSDVARANVLAIEACPDRAPGSHAAYNVCSGRPVAIGEVAAAIVAGTTDAAGLAPRVTGEFRIGDVRHIVASPALAARELGFRAAVAPEDGLRDFAQAPLRD